MSSKGKFDIAVINASTVLSDDQIRPAVAALQKQVSQHFAPAWGSDARLTVVPRGQRPAPKSWWLAILDNSDQAGALGYHDLTDEGLPLGKVFAASDITYGFEWTVTASHELLEMLADPDINLTVFVQSDATRGLIYMHEVCDACEADELGYRIDGVLVSDFVFPAWFESFWPAGATQFDFQKKIDKPFDLLPGGYIGVFDVRAGTGWQQLTADAPVDTASAAAVVDALRRPAHYRYDMRPRIGSRRERRRTPRDRWLRSSVKVLAAVG